jgi:hypothetical protein
MTLCETVQDFLTQEEIEWGPTDQPNVLKVGLTGENGFFFGYVYVDEKERMILFRTVAPLKAPDEKKPDILMLLAWINSHIPVGNLEMDLSDGEITCRTSIILGESGCHPALLDHLIGMNLYVIDLHFPAVRGVILGCLSVEKAIERIKRQRRSDGRSKVNHEGPVGGELGEAWRGSMN